MSERERCKICGWPLDECDDTAQGILGCTEDSCCDRPSSPTEQARVRRVREELEAIDDLGPEPVFISIRTDDGRIWEITGYPADPDPIRQNLREVTTTNVTSEKH